MPLAYPLSSLDELALSLPAYHSPHTQLPLAKPPLAPVDDPAVSDDPDSSPSALSSYSPYPGSYDQRPSPGSFSSLSPPTTSERDAPLRPRVAVEDAHFAFAVAPAPQPYFFDRRRSLPTPQYRAAYPHAAAHPPLSSSVPTQTAFPQDQHPQAHAQYSPRPSSSYAYPANGGPWDAPAHAPSKDQGPFTTQPVDGAAHELALTATSAALIGHPLAANKPDDSYYDDGAWIEPGAARPDTAGSASGAHAYGEAAPRQDAGEDDEDEQLDEGAEGQVGQKGKSGKTYSFVALPGNAVKKRPRRRYDEIERLYRCSFPSCTKAYGTLNHLNAHVTMQKHGSKRSPGEFKELRKQWRLQKKEQEEMNRDRVRYAQLELEQEESRRAAEYMSLPHQQMPTGLPIPAHGMRSELVNVGIPIDVPSSLQTAMGVGLRGSMALSPGSLAAFPPPAMGMPAGHGLVGPGQSYLPPFDRARTAGSFEFHMQQQSLHPHAQAQAGQQHHQHHRASVDADAHARYDYEQRRASFDHGHVRAYDQGHRVGGGGYAEMQQQQPVNMVYRRRGSQPYPSPHSLTHSPHAQGPTSPRSMYGHSTGGLAYPDEEYGEGYEYHDRQQQQPHSPVEERFSAEGEYYLDRTQQPPRWEQLPPLTPHQTQQHALALAAQPHGHLASGLVQAAAPSAAMDAPVASPDAAGDSGEPLLASHVSLGSNRLPPNSTLLTPLPNFRGYEQQQDERWAPEEDERDERRAV